MNNHEERLRFERFWVENFEPDTFDDVEYSEILNTYDSNYIITDDLNRPWLAWQARAKAQAVPEGFVLIKASDRDQEMLELIDQRDHMESQAEELKDKLQALYGVDFGEHSSCNFPFQNAIDYDDSDLVLVPKEPTEAMYIAGIDKRQSGGNTADVYKAMIEAQEQSHV